MSLRTTLQAQASSIAVGSALLLILIPICYSTISFVLTTEAQDGEPFLEMPDKRYKECVKETMYMRFHHMDLLKESRERVVRHGERDGILLDNCRGCHQSKERFCNQCHENANVNLDCFGCHYYPEVDPET
jgi:hypothetical protein